MIVRSVLAFSIIAAVLFLVFDKLMFALLAMLIGVFTYPFIGRPKVEPKTITAERFEHDIGL